MKFILKSVLLILFILQQVNAQDEFELVESVLAETLLETSTLPRTLDVWLKMINEAKESIDIETFYFANEKDSPLEQVMAALKNAAARNVKIRIIVDSSFYSGSDKSVDELEGIENISIRKIPMGLIAGGVMHAKYFIVDKENLFLGSQNMDWRALIHIHEMGVRVKNVEIAKTFGEVFENDWSLCNHIVKNNSDSISFVSSVNPVSLDTDNFGKINLYPAFSPEEAGPPGMSSEEKELLKIIYGAKGRLLIQIYSYSLKTRKDIAFNKIDSSLREAAARGVDIKIIMPDWAIRESSIDDIKKLSAVSNIQIKFCTFPQYSGGFIPYSRVDHSKYFVADENVSWISTSNWEYGYFNNSRNATLIIDNPKVNEELEKAFHNLWNSPYTSLVDVNKTYEPVKRK